MKLKVKKSDIIDVLAKIQGITGRKSNLLITENLLVQSYEKGIKIQATDLETGFEGYYPAKVELNGTIAVNSKKLYEIVKNFPKETISISEGENSRVQIGGQNVEYNIPGRNTDDFPEIPTIDDMEFFTIDSSDLKRMIEQTVMIQAGVEEKRAHIIGIRFECIKKDKKLILQMVSTDGKRLAKADYKYNGKKTGLAPGENVLIPKKGLAEITKFLDQDTNVKIGVKDNNFVVKKNKETMILSLLEGNFPEFSQILNFNKNNVLKFDKNSFKMLLKRMSILTSGDYKGVFFEFEKDSLVVSTANPELGDSREVMALDFKEKPFKVAFNPQFFLDTLNFLESDVVLMNIKDDENPCLIKDEKDDSFLSVIMPMKI